MSFFALCSASLIHCITLTYSQESVHSHLNAIFNEGARGMAAVSGLCFSLIAQDPTLSFNA